MIYNFHLLKNMANKSHNNFISTTSCFEIMIALNILLLISFLSVSSLLYSLTPPLSDIAALDEQYTTAGNASAIITCTYTATSQLGKNWGTEQGATGNVVRLI